MGDRVSIQFVNGNQKSAVLFGHWAGMDLVNRAKEFVKSFSFGFPGSGCSTPLTRREPGLALVNFVLWYFDGGFQDSGYYIVPTERDGDNSDNGHFLIDLKPVVEYKVLKTVFFQYNSVELKYRRLAVTEETDLYISGKDLDDDDKFKKFLKNKIVGKIYEAVN